MSKMADSGIERQQAEYTRHKIATSLANDRAWHESYEEAVKAIESALNEYAAAQDAEIARLREIEQHYRVHLWLNHGCPLSSTYGDDGEMQCHGLDFKRMSIEELESRLLDRKVAALRGEASHE